jgi:cation:H+ antiporter
VGKDTIQKDIPFSALCALLLLWLGTIGISDTDGMVLGHMDGILLLALFVYYIIMLVRRTLKAQKAGETVEVEGGSDEEIKLLSVPKSLLFIVGGGAAIAIGGDLTVDTASRIAAELGMSQTLIGLTIVSIGTSLPELVTSIVAARKNEIGMALGNAIGSNVFNILMVLGIAAAISPIAFITENIIDIAILLAFTLIVWLFAATKRRLSRPEGIVMLALYAAYAVYIFIR